MKVWQNAAAISAAAVALYCAFFLYGSRRRCGRVSKQCRREMTRLKRRERKDQRLQTKRLEKTRQLAIQRAQMTEEQKNEQRERIRMQRVEQYQKLEDGQREGIRVVVDLAFAVEQTERERNSIFKQLGCVYGYLKACPLDRLLSLQLASCTPELAEVCKKHGALSWKIGRHEEPLEQLYREAELVYLSPDSGTVLEALYPSCVYIVGGIVDRSVRKGESMAKASTHGIRTARLPLQEYSQQQVRTHIMNLDSVLIVLNEVANHGDWERAFLKAVPPRISSSKVKPERQMTKDIK